MLAHYFLAVLASGGVVFLIYFDLSLLRELLNPRSHNTTLVSLGKRPSRKKSPVLHRHHLDAIERGPALRTGAELKHRKDLYPFLLLAFAVAFLILSASPVLAQQTIFNVPSGDVLDKAKVYGEFDFSFLPQTRAGTYTPRLVAGIGHRIEVGINLNGITSPGPSETTPTPTIKWKAYDGGTNGWAFIVGTDGFIPAQNKTYDAGLYTYAEFTKTLKSQTRFTFGAFNFTRNVVSTGDKAGGQFGVEQPVGKRVTLAADWFTGKHGSGYFTPGAVIKLNSKLTAYTAYELGNSGISNGNHLLLLEIGWNLN